MKAIFTILFISAIGFIGYKFHQQRKEAKKPAKRDKTVWTPQVAPPPIPTPTQPPIPTPTPRPIDPTQPVLSEEPKKKNNTKSKK